jgi:hypothetical protein
MPAFTHSNDLYFANNPPAKTISLMQQLPPAKGSARPAGRKPFTKGSESTGTFTNYECVKVPTKLVILPPEEKYAKLRLRKSKEVR